MAKYSSENETTFANLVVFFKKKKSNFHGPVSQNNYGLNQQLWYGMADVLSASSSSGQTKNEKNLAFMKLYEIIWNKVISILEIVIKV